jgi:glycerol-3-phosphate dehydrogenase subunit C
VEKANPAHYTSDCPMAGHQIESGLTEGMAGREPEHPLRLLRIAYGL